MEVLLGKVTQQAMNYAIRSGITISASYAIRQSSRLLKNVGDSRDREELRLLQDRLHGKMQILAPAIDMIELISARGNTTLESAVALTKSLRSELQVVGQKLESVSQGVEKRSSSSAADARQEQELKAVLGQMKKLLSRIDDAVPLINLAITTSGASLSTALPSTVSPSRLLQASTFLTAGDTQYSSIEFQSVQIGPTFTLSLYMLFSSHLRPQNEEEMRSTTWKEVIRKARVKLVRAPINAINKIPMPCVGARDARPKSNGEDLQAEERLPSLLSEVRSDEFAYQILIIEDLDDNLVHDFEDPESTPISYDDVPEVGICEALPIHEISKIFYADTGKILNIGHDEEMHHPILLLKRDLNAIPPRRMMERSTDDNDSDSGFMRHSRASDQFRDAETASRAEVDAQPARERTESPPPLDNTSDRPSRMQSLPQDLDPEWLAFEVYVESNDSDAESEPETPSVRPAQSREPSLDPELANGLSNLRLNGDSHPSTPTHPSQRQLIPLRSPSTGPGSSLPAIRTSLSLLETLLRLLSLQQFQQTSHLSIPDELLNFFLSESATTGAATGDEATRRRLRHEARLRVGFDPYDESPIKRRGEEYQYRGGHSQAGWGEFEGPEEPWLDDEGAGAIRDGESPRSPLLLKDRVTPSPRGSAYDRSSPSLPGPLGGRRGGRPGGLMSPRTPYGLRNSLRGAEGRVSSPLTRSAAGMTDEGVALTSEGERPESRKATASPDNA